MVEQRQVIRVFLASPGDLLDERRIVRGAVDEFNGLLAEEFGVQVELLGWEEAGAGVGRPQHLINNALDRCDLLVGMMWKRWGTPPSRGGKYTSGFEEEFERSLQRWRDTRSPEIAMYFKSVSQEYLADPGEDLKKVNAFRSRLEADKEVLFVEFSEARDMHRLAFKSITEFVRRHTRPTLTSASGSARESETEQESDGRKGVLRTVEGFEFLEVVRSRLREGGGVESMTAVEVARFRLLANSISKGGNNPFDLGAHDINLIYAERIGIGNLSQRELQTLARLGFRDVQNENVPLWSWYSSVKNAGMDLAVFSSLAGATEGEKVGALWCLGALSRELQRVGEQLGRDDVIRMWMAEESPSKVRLAALDYLAKVGLEEDVVVAKRERDRSDSNTSRGALQCILRILIRFGRAEEAVKEALQSNFEDLDSDLIESVVIWLEGAGDEILREGMGHLNPAIRLKSLTLLGQRRQIDVAAARQMCGDKDARVRDASLRVLEALGEPMDPDYVKGVLVRPRKDPWPLGHGSDSEGEALLEARQAEVARLQSESELTRDVEQARIFDDEAYFALCDRFFSRHKQRLRADVEDRFGAYFVERLERTRQDVGGSREGEDLLGRLKGVEKARRKELTRRGLDILCDKGRAEDRGLIRQNLIDRYADLSLKDARYLFRRGQWEDVPVLVGAAETGRAGLLLGSAQRDSLQDVVAKAIAAMGRQRDVSEVLGVKMPAGVLRRLILSLAESRFTKAQDSVLMKLLDHEASEVRKAAAIMSVKALPKKRVAALLAGYLGREEYRYYNVVHWLDAGVALSRHEARSVAGSVRW